QEIPDRGGPLLRKPRIIRQATDGVGVTFDLEQFLITQASIERLAKTAPGLDGFGLELRRAEFKRHFEVDHRLPLRVGSLRATRGRDGRWGLRLLPRRRRPTGSVGVNDGTGR